MVRRSTSASPQSSFAGFGVSEPTDRLFFALFPDAASAARIGVLAQSLRAAHGLQGKPLREDRFHVTLHHLGDYSGLPQDLVAMAEAAAAGITMSAFEVAFDSVSSFTGRAHKLPCVLRATTGGVAALVALQDALGERMKGAGLSRWVGHEFTPHVTLLYDDRGIAVEPADTVAWTVREFVLVHSLLGKTEHRILGRWRLRDPDAATEDARGP